MGKVIEIRDLTKIYKNGRGIKNISLDADEGDMIGLLGPNGSGKTTIMKLMTGLLRPDSGRIRIFGKDTENHFEEISRRTGALIEAPAVYRDMTAYRNVKLVADMYGIESKRIDEILDRVRLTQYKNEKAGKFSLGMKQRLGLAMAFIAEPQLAILDEPVNGLDIEGVVEVREVIREMNERLKTTFIISSHMASEIEKLCNKVAVIYEGELIDLTTIENATSLHPSLEEYFLDIIKAKRGSAV